MPLGPTPPNGRSPMAKWNKVSFTDTPPDRVFCRIVSTVSCVVPEREGDEMATWPNYSGRVRSFHYLSAGSLLADR